jgi:OHCU decarboxylase
VITVNQLDEMSNEEAGVLLMECCGSSRWVAMMLARRPFRSRDAVFFAADSFWNSLTQEDYLEAFAHHPRIGEQKTEKPQGETAKKWSASEQLKVSEAGPALKRELADVNRQYESRFGYIYIVCAAGKTAEELLRIAKQRLLNDPRKEMDVAREEQRKIMQLRLEKLVGNREEGIG